jgi:hypothetical protein
LLLLLLLHCHHALSVIVLCVDRVLVPRVASSSLSTSSSSSSSAAPPPPPPPPPPPEPSRCHALCSEYEYHFDELFVRRVSEVKGYGLFAAEDLPAGTIIPVMGAVNSADDDSYSRTFTFRFMCCKVYLNTDPIIHPLLIPDGRPSLPAYDNDDEPNQINDTNTIGLSLSSSKRRRPESALPTVVRRQRPRLTLLLARQVPVGGHGLFITAYANEPDPDRVANMVLIETGAEKKQRSRSPLLGLWLVLVTNVSMGTELTWHYGNAIQRHWQVTVNDMPIGFLSHATPLFVESDCSGMWSLSFSMCCIDWQQASERQFLRRFSLHVSSIRPLFVAHRTTAHQHQ